MRLSCISLIVPLVCGVALSVLAADRTFASYASVKPVLDELSDRLPEVPGGSMRQAGVTDVQYNHDAVGWYRKR